MRNVFFHLILIFFAQKLSAQSFHFEQFSLDEGLPQSEIFQSAMIIHSDGKIWAGTNGSGLAVLEGKKFKVFHKKEGLVGNQIWSLFEDSKGRIWIASFNSGVFMFDGFTFRNYFDKENKIKPNLVFPRFSESKDGRIWLSGVASTTASLFVLKDSVFEDYLQYDSSLQKYPVIGLVDNIKGEFYLNNLNGICELNQDGKFVLAHKFPQKGLAEGKRLFLHQKDNRGHYWISAFGNNPAEHQLLRFDGIDYTSYPIPNEAGLTVGQINHVFSDSQGLLWISFNSKRGIYCYNGKSFKHFHNIKEIELGGTTFVKEDKEGNIWIASRGGGIVKATPSIFTNFSEENGLSEKIISHIFEDSTQRVWVGGFGGTISYLDTEDDEFTTVFNSQNQAIGRVFKIIQHPTKIGFMIAAQSGIYHFDGKDKLENITQEMGYNVNNLGFQAISNIDGKIYTGTFQNGLGVYDIASKTSGFINNPSVSFVNTRDIQKHPDGKIYIASQGGLIMYSNDSLSYVTFPNGNSLGLILQLAIDKKGRIWVASYTSGLCMYDGKTVRKYDSNDGFPFDFAYSILTDRIDNIWVGTQKGVYKIVADEKGNLINVKVFNKNHGLSFEEMNGNAIFLDSKERIWVGHLKGVSYYDPKHDAENQINPVTYINQVNLGLEITNWKDSLNWQYYSDLQKWTWIPTKLELPSYLNSINLTFSSNSYRIPQEVRFQWKLSPIDKDWQSITNRTEASYAGLSQGKYTFNVRSVNESGVWSEPTQFSFIIQPPFWQTWWFRLTGFVLVTGVVFSGFRARVKSIERKKQELEKLVAIRTQEVVKQKDEILAKNTELEQQQEEILAQREEIEKRNHLLADANESLHESNRNITSSINYAKRIQEAMLPNPSKLSKTLPHFMLFFDPRDIVSGDFYWFYERDKGKKQWIAAVDCTGHGVPGAFMSLVGMNQLNDILDKTDEDLQPNEILNKLNLRIRRGLKQDETQNRDGMDMALCMIDHEARTISFAGAKNPLVIINEKGIQTIKGDRIPIGGLQKEGGHRFTNHQFSLDEFSAETTFYMFSDGFQDQFGGIRGSEKYTSKRFRELLASIYHKSPENQIEILKSTLREWIGHEKRLDDILVVGFRVV